jgi:uncharacterized caspase-like protein
MTMLNALVVGINAYKERPLSGCINDANEVSKLLERHENGEANFTVTTLKDVPTKAELKRAILELFRPQSDIALFYFSGHGSEDFFGYHLVTPDTNPNDLGVSINELMHIVRKSPAKNKIIILDCCRAGGGETTQLTKGMATYLDEGVTILTSSRHDQLSVEINGHGVFTNLLIEALKGGAADLNGDITPGGIYAFVDKALGKDQQRPVFKTNISEFVSLRKIIPQVPRETILSLAQFFSTANAEQPLNPSWEDTNDPGRQIPLKAPYAILENTKKFKLLQKLVSIGLVVPVGEDHMYFAAMNEKSCKLTPLGKHYWSLIRNNRI